MKKTSTPPTSTIETPTSTLTDALGLLVFGLPLAVLAGSGALGVLGLAWTVASAVFIGFGRAIGLV